MPRRDVSGDGGVSPLKRLREQASLSQEELARRIGVSVKTISNWERGVYPATMTVPQVKAICEALGVSLAELPDSFAPVENGFNR
ncbi:helix-turn-helix transcriptional regulator [Sphaerothrix gracilis]|uniref:helix-turn-helix transcriptional regulator n=1 Tax=Sphaerothrix gracilis TaxID=3151835 RepID=UPI0031FD24DD